MGRSCLALVKVIGRRRVPFPPLKTSPFISPSINNATLHPGDVHELFPRTESWWPQFSGTSFYFGPHERPYTLRPCSWWDSSDLRPTEGEREPRSRASAGGAEVR